MANKQPFVKKFNFDDVLYLRALWIYTGISYDTTARLFTSYTGIPVTGVGTQWMLNGELHQRGVGSHAKDRVWLASAALAAVDIERVYRWFESKGVFAVQTGKTSVVRLRDLPHKVPSWSVKTIGLAPDWLDQVRERVKSQAAHQNASPSQVAALEIAEAHTEHLQIEGSTQTADIDYRMPSADPVALLDAPHSDMDVVPYTPAAETPVETPKRKSSRKRKADKIAA